MPARLVVDSGPLVALFDRSDQHHSRSIGFLRGLAGEFVSNLAVVTEVCYLLDFSRHAQADFLSWIRRGAITLVDLQPEDWDRILELMEKYAELSVDFTDASLAAICERLHIRRVATIDHHFGIYRYKNRQTFQNAFPAG